MTFSIESARYLIGAISENASETCQTTTIEDEQAFAYAVNHLVPLAERLEKLELALTKCVEAHGRQSDYIRRPNPYDYMMDEAVVQAKELLK